MPRAIEEYIVQQYVDERRSYSHIAVEIKMSPDSVRQFLNKKGLIRFRGRTFTETEKWCSGCRQVLPLETFGNDAQTASGKCAYCKPCIAKRGERYAHLKPHYRRRARYGISKEEFGAMVESQKGECLICRRKKKLVVDHDHKTGSIRGLLCGGCNVMLGHFRDSAVLIQRVINYLLDARQFQLPILHLTQGQHGQPKQPKPPRQYISRPKVDEDSVDVNYLTDQYVNQMRTYYEIAADLNVDAESLRILLKKKGLIRIDRRRFTDTHKWCNVCRQMRPLEEFGKSAKSPSGKQAYCKPCALKNAKQYDQKSYRRKALYGLTEAEYNTMAERQNGKCAICARRRKLGIDHDHKTETVRGLLCNVCNAMLGHYEDDIALIQNAIAYLQQAAVAEPISPFRHRVPARTRCQKEWPSGVYSQ